MIWPFSSKKNEFKVPEFKSIKFGNFLYAPAPDITAYELAMLAPIFGTVMVRTDVKTYIVENKLHRHFIDTSLE